MLLRRSSFICTSMLWPAMISSYRKAISESINVTAAPPSASFEFISFLSVTCDGTFRAGEAYKSTERDCSDQWGDYNGEVGPCPSANPFHVRETYVARA
ncbi:hypothetical protein FHX06_006878 [Rhizobium sp. BK512]|jgi:hypothetical protein|nr:hypothetical protein [Rhizobium sp. BK379]MBB3565508.1 hypothetical protein [Rhizobium sp. BK512]